MPTISRKVSDLEAHLKTRLLIRSTRRLTLTDAGAAYIAAARRILDQVDEAERVAAGEYAAPRGELVVAAPIVFGRLHILPIVNDFLAKFAAVNAHLLLSDRNMHLIDDHIDVALRIGVLPDSAWWRPASARCAAWSAPAPPISPPTGRPPRHRTWPIGTAYPSTASTALAAGGSGRQARPPT